MPAVRAVIAAALALLSPACTLIDAPTGRPSVSSPPTGGTEAPGGTGPSGVQRAAVVRVVDGDTAVMRLDGSGATERVRFIGIDTPESTTRHEPYGAEASRFTTRRIAGAEVYLEFDVGLRDRYGRLLAYVWLEPPGANADVRTAMLNAILVREGYAQMATFPPNVRYEAVFRALQREAREAGRGLWRTP